MGRNTRTDNKAVTVSLVSLWGPTVRLTAECRVGARLVAKGQRLEVALAVTSSPALSNKKFLNDGSAYPHCSTGWHWPGGY